MTLATAAPVAATAAATTTLAARHAGSEFYRPAWDGLGVSSIGLGTYLGEPDAATDAHYAAALRHYLQLGGNLIDGAINYRFQRSERTIGAALRAAITAGEVSRDQVVLCTKGGYLSFDGDWPADPDTWVRKNFLETQIVQPDEIVNGHCIAPAYLRHQIAQSRANLQVECLDLYYLHNPESQLAAVGPSLFQERLREAFAACEVAVTQGHIRAYGAATWNGLRAAPGAPDYLTLKMLVDTARDVAGDRHHFRAVQLPLNLRMLEAISGKNQPSHNGLASLLQAAGEYAIAVMASASLLQSQLIGRLPDALRTRFEPGLTDAQRAIQFVRSAPGLTAALVGMRRVAHVDENFGLRSVPPMESDTWRALFQL